MNRKVGSDHVVIILSGNSIISLYGNTNAYRKGRLVIFTQKQSMKQ